MADLTYSVDISTKQATASLRNLQKQIKKTDNVFAKLGKSFAKASFKVASGGIKALAASAAVATAAFVAFGTQTIRALDNIQKASSKLGVSAQFLSSWQVVAQEAGLTTENFTIGLQRFLRRIGEAQTGAGTLVKPLKELGITLKDSNGNFKDGTAVFEEYIKALAGTDNATTKLRLAFAAFDTEGVAMVNIAKMTAEQIDEIRAAAERAGRVVGDDLVQAAADANDAFTRLFGVGTGFKFQFFGALAPDIEKFADTLEEKILQAVENAGGMEVFARRLAGQFLVGLADFIEAMGQVIDRVVDAFKFGTNQLKTILVGLSPVIPGFSAEFGNAEEQATKLRNRLDEINDVLENMSFGEKLAGSITPTSRVSILRLQKDQIEKDLKAIEEGSMVFFEKMEMGTNKAEEAFAGMVESIRKSGEELQEPVVGFYEDAILRIARLNKLLEDSTADTSTGSGRGDGQAELETRKKDLEELKKKQEDAAEANRVFGDSFRALRDRLLPLQAAQRKYNEELAILDRALDEGLISSELYAKALAKLDETFNEFKESLEEGPQTFIEGWKSALDEYVERAGDAAQNAKELFTTATRGMEDAIVNFAKTGKLSFRSLLQDIAEQLLRSQIRQLMGNLFGGGGSSGGGNFFSNLFAGFFANGGYIPGGQFGIVGERGAELVSGPANVTPLQGMGSNVTYNINAVDTDSFRNLVASDPTFIHAVVQQGQQEFRSA